ncbi:MAG: TrmH family RNA methyltransferase, partial [Lachnospiraceae bacterium]|nr:TrmH family RNA methyltransferase [Lachnospiraceae bacterium]
MQSYELKPYKKDFEYSYAPGAFPTFELLNKCPKQALGVLVSPTFTEAEKLKAVCAKHGIEVWEDAKRLSRLSDKENVFVMGVFGKYTQDLSAQDPHIVLVSPSNMGNAGTILRTALAFGYHDIAIIGTAVDMNHPKVVRSSMGARFSLRIRNYETFEEYRRDFPEHEIYTFMLTGKKQLTVAEVDHRPEGPFSLVFGNEATGLPPEYEEYGRS